MILCLSTISVILQPLLSKFSFLINLVSRNGSFCFSSLDLRFLTNLPAFQLNSSWSLPSSPSFYVPILGHIYKSLPAFFPKGDEIDQLTICLSHAVASSLIMPHHLFYFIYANLDLCVSDPTPPLNLSINVLIFVIYFCVVCLSELWFYCFCALVHELNGLFF